MNTIYLLMCTSQLWNENEKIKKRVVCAFENLEEAKQTCKNWNRRKKDPIYNKVKYTIEKCPFFESDNK